MGDIKRRVWVSAATRQIVSQRLQLLLLVASIGIGVSVFLEFIGGLLWLLILVSQRASAQQLDSMKLASYCLFGTGGVGIAACGCVWLVFVRLARAEVRDQEMRHAPQHFKFPEAATATAAATAAAADAADANPLTVAPSVGDIHFTSNVQQHRNLLQQQQQQLQPHHQLLRPLSVRGLSSSSSLGMASPPPGSVMSGSTAFTSLSRPISQRTLPLERPRFVSQSESLTLGSLPRSGSRPSSITTNSSRDQLIL